MKHLYQTIRVCGFFSCLLYTFLAKGATFVVDNAGDADDMLAYTVGNGTNTLRKCMRLANSNANAPTVDIINFNSLPGVGPYQITPATNLPSIIEPVYINGFTAPGAAAPTPFISIRGNGAGPSPINNAFNISPAGTNSTIRGFAIYRILNDGIYINNAPAITIEGCWIGIMQNGTLPAAANDRVNGHGIYITTNANNCIIGTTTARNIISGNVGHGIVLVGSSGATIKNNYIGTNNTGVAAIANNLHGINLDNSTGTIIGGAAANEGNLISGNNQMGITIVNLSHNPVIKGNKIGTNVTGANAIPNVIHGINIDNSTGAIIGGSLTGEGNLISGNTQTGLVITNASSNAVIRGNKIGTNLAGTAAVGNSVHGITIYANVLGTTIGGGLAGEGNLISGNGQNGIDNTDNSHNTVIQGNYIGTNLAGAAAIGNGTHGVLINGVNNVTIGGNTKLKRNVISGNGNANGENGIGILNSNNNTIQGNFIGITANGLIALGNFDSGISITNSTGNTIGGSNYMERNVSSSHGVHGIYFFNVDNTTITGNYIGTDSTGNATLRNFNHGIHTDGGCNLDTWTANVVGGNGSNIAGTNVGNGFDLLATTNNTFYGNYIGLGINGITDIGNLVQGFRLGASSTNNTIGGSGAGQRNYMSGNGNHGMMFDGQSSGNTVKNNYVGCDITGLIAVPNNNVGLLLLDGADNTIVGGAGANEGNIFAASIEGCGIQCNISSGNTFYGNLIGVDKNGTLTPSFANYEHGILFVSYEYLSWSANTNRVGGLAAGQQNIIANNRLDGIRIAAYGGAVANFNPLVGNKIYCNGGLGINMENNGGNENQGIAAPVVTSSLTNSIGGTGTAGNTIHVYRNQYTDGARCDCEGEIYVGTTVVTGGGTWSLTHSLALTTAQALSVTATQTNATNSTSEFWVCSQPLPVDLLTLEAKKNNTTVSINFTVNNESNIAIYHILRSSDGIHFEMIGSVDPLNLETQVTAYTFEDLQPLNGISYYRIQTVELDGHVAHSKIVHATSASSTYLFPNPATEAVNIAASGIVTRVEIYNSVGQSVLEHNTAATEITILLSHLSTGIYYAKVFEGDKAEVFKIEKK